MSDNIVYKIHEVTGTHRGQKLTAFYGYDDSRVYGRVYSRYIDGIRCMLSRFENNQWWIISCNKGNDAVFTDMGPYDTFDEGRLSFILASTPKID